MPTVVPVDEFTGGWYPGYDPEYFEAPYIVDRPSPFRRGDEERFWYLDFHWSRGLTPLAATIWASDGYCWGTQHAAENLPLPTGRGVAVRFAGTHLYGSPIPEADPRITRSKDRVELKTAEVPSLLALPPGCTFHPRCPLAEAGLCDVLVPELLPLPAREAREVACHVAIRERTPAAELIH